MREAVLEKLRARPAYYLAEYTRRFGNVLNTDDAATLFPEYNDSNETRAKYRLAVQPAASWIRNELFRRALLEPGKETVVFIGGGPGAGKSTLLRQNPSIAENAKVVFDAILSDLPGVEQLVDQARKARREVSVTCVHRDPLDAYGSVLERAVTEGRLPSIEYFLAAREGASRTVRGLQERHADDPQVEVRAIENRGPERQATFQALDTLPVENYNELRGQLHELVESEHAAGRISEATYQQARRDDSGPESRLVRGTGDDWPGSGVGGDSGQEGPRDGGEPTSLRPDRPGSGESPGSGGVT